MTKAQIAAYCATQGVPHDFPVNDGKARLRVMDKTQLPMVVRESLDARGYFIEPVTEQPEIKPGPEIEEKGIGE